MKVPLNKDLTYFAKTNFRGASQMFGIKRKDRRQHMYVLGKSGTGKSVLLENMIIQNIQNGEGVCVVDPHGELVEKILHSIPPDRVNDVIYFNPADTDYHIGFNVLQLDDPKYKHLVASGLMGIFTKIWANAWSSRMEYILNNAILALLDTPGTTLLGIPRLLVDKDYRQTIINNLKDPVVKAFWVHEYEAWRDQFRNEAIAPIQNKVGQFLSTSIVRNVVGQSKSTIDIFEIMNSGKIFLVNVSKGRIGEDNSALLGGMIITKLQLAAMERVRIPENERKDFYLFVDEFQNFVTDSFASILSEARKYRLCLTIAHQYIAQLVTDSSAAVRDAVFGNVGTMIVFRVGAADADFLEKEFEPEFTPENVVALPNYHIYLKLMVDGITSRPFSATTLPPIEINADAHVGETIIEASRRLYTRPKEVVEDEINRWSGMVPALNEEGVGKFKADCTNCKKSIYVPFEPQPGLPIYCKDCLFKIKNGELEPDKGFRPPKQQKDTQSYDALSSLGIEYKLEGGSNNGNRSNSNPRKDFPRGLPRPVQNGAVPKMPFKKERKGPDTIGLHSAIESALSDSIGKVINKNNPLPKTQSKDEAKTEIVQKPINTISLNNLKRKEEGSTETEKPKQVLTQKEAREENVSNLRNAVLSAIGKSADAPKNEIKIENKEEDNKKKDQDKLEAEKRALEAERLTLQKEREAIKAREEEQQKIIEDTKKEEERKRKEVENQKLEESKSKEEKPEKPQKKVKEIPEDVLKKVLE